tara:strand:- start:415 stop:816 length:402 start_codon:yes stop_codon:yes gene_type:complete
MEEKYLYFRTVAAIATDDQIGQDSCCFPLSSLAGMVPTADGVLTLYFKSMTNYDGDADGADEFVISDSVALTLGTNNTHKRVMKDLTNFFSSSKKGMLVIADDAADEADLDGPRYASTYISAVGTITIAAMNS